MSKGRKYGAERLLAAPPIFAGGGHETCGDLPDLSEDDVWPAFHAASSDGSAFTVAAAEDDRWPRIGRWADRPVGGLSIAFDDAYRGIPAAAADPRRDRRPVASSAPVDVPSWPRSIWAGSGGPPPEEAEDEEELEGEWLPPHEYLARAHGRSVAASVLEGVGRTLKGRDVSRVRDAVWNQTGFYG